MHDRSTPCIPPGPSFDPWLELYLCARLCRSCFERAAARVAELPTAERGNAEAVAARAWMVLKRPAEAVRAWERAQAHGGPEVDALAGFILPDGLRRAESRADRPGSPAARADRWCDVAALRLQWQAGEGAGAAIASALAACPDHLEARHWLRFLALPDALAEADRIQGRPSRRGSGLAAQDAEELVPYRANGWVSRRRLHTRLGPEARGPSAATGCGLARLEDAGVTAFYLGSEADYRRLPGRDALVQAELEMTTVAEHVTEGRPAAPLARAAWLAALASGDRQRVQDVAEQLCALATRAADLVELGAECADWLASVSPNPALFGAYAAWFAATRGAPDAGRRAESVLGAGTADELVWRLAVSALYQVGSIRKADAFVAAARLDPRLRLVAGAFDDTSAGFSPPRVHCSPRLRSRSSVDDTDALFS